MDGVKAAIYIEYLSMIADSNHDDRWSDGLS